MKELKKLYQPFYHDYMYIHIFVYVKDNKGLLFSLVTLKISLSYCTLKQVYLVFPKLTGNV